MDSSFTKETEKTCVLCCQDIDIFALGKCDHPVCYRCSTKMRVLCEQKYCAVCREELDKVVFVKKLATFSTLPYHKFQCEKKHDIYFSDGTIYTQFRRLLLPECPHCPEPRVFSRFEELEQHVRKQHELFCCKLCTKHLKIFSHERKWYNRKELARHRTQGDPDNTSHRGHPLCKFCDDRYLDNDELLKHLRRDHYFCHFCDADGAQEYYSDYQYLSEHFRESHYLCEEGRCAGEQFTHAFRTEIDYKAHKAAAHSKNRAEARQNRHIDLQFKYAPRPQRRGEGVGMGMVTGEDYEEMRQGGRGGRGRTHGGQKSWRYNREEEDREVAAAMRASMAVRRQEERAPVQDRTARRHEERSSVQDRVARQPEERGPAQDRGARRQEERASVQERGAQKYRNEERLERVERADRQETDELRHRTGPIKPTTEPPVRTMKSKNPLGEDEDFPVLGAPVPTPVPSSKPAPTVASRGPLKEDDFPSLSSASVLSPLTPAYSAQPRKTSSFQDEDFPALVSKIPPRHAAGGASAWSAYAGGGGGAGGKPSAVPNSRAPSGPPAAASAAPSSLAGPQTLSSSSSVSLSSRRKKKGGENARPAPPRPSSSSSDEEGGSGGPTQREFRPVPTMLDISSLLTVKGGGGGRPPAPTPVIPDATPNPSASKASKKKKTQQQQKNTHCPSTPTKAAASMETAAAQKENVPEPSQNKPAPASVATAAATPAGATSGMTNGYAEKALPPPTKKAGAQAATPHPVLEPPPKDEEEFPALTTKKPPPGFKSSFPLKSSTAPAAPCSGVPAPPPGLAGKPPPGFTGIPLNGNVVEPAPPAALDRPPQLSDSYLVPENFQQRNMELIQSIRNYLYNDESKFNQFKNYSGQFRQGLMSAVLYHRSCKELLGENFNRIFNELLVLLPDTGKQQELLAAHGDYKALEKQSGGGGGGGKKNKNKRSAWQTPAANANAVLAELDCQVCPTCRQVLAPEDLNSHKTLHLGESEDFPSLQSISRIIS